MPGHDMWCTPPEFFDVVNEEFKFDLDVAATPKNSLCDEYITPEKDALIMPWYGDSVWCNPPYSMIGEFVKRGYEECVQQRNLVCLLIPAYTDPKYWANYVMKAHEIRFLKGRLQFLENGQKKQSARFPSVLVVFKWIKGNHYGIGPKQWVWDWRA